MNIGHPLSIGTPCPNRFCLILDDYFQSVQSNQIGELYIGGSGLFRGYYNRPELTQQVLIELYSIITGDIRTYYRTGDLVKLNNQSEIDFIGRTDFQVKLRGQRIETSEIEAVILRAFEHNTAPKNIQKCLVTKVTDEQTQQDYLAAYLQTDTAGLEPRTQQHLEKQMKAACQKQLPSYMIPSFFIFLNQLPLNSNGKVDRKKLINIFRSQYEDAKRVLRDQHSSLIEPQSDLEKKVYHIWESVLQLDCDRKVSMQANFYELGGNSLLMIKLNNMYREEFSRIDGNKLGLQQLLKNSTIADHVLLIEGGIAQTETANGHYTNVDQLLWKPLYLTEGRVSFAQERIWFDAKIRFDEQLYETAIYNEPVVVRVQKSNVSINRLKRAINEIIRKHAVLRTAIIYDPNDECLKQYVKPMPPSLIAATDFFSFDITHISPNEEEFHRILAEEQRSISSLNVAEGILLRCHIICLRQNASVMKNQPKIDFDLNSDILNVDDIILFIFHHIAFDATSGEIFLNDLHLAYESNEHPLPPLPLQYIDFAYYERDLDMSAAKDYWIKQLSNFKNLSPINLPYDYKHELQRTRSGKSSSVHFNVEKTLANQMLSYAEERKVTLFQLCLAMYYSYLCKLTGASHICVGGVTANRYNPVLQSLIGMFVNTIPYCLQFEPSSTSFDKILSEVQKICLDALPHTHFPYQEISHLHGQQQMKESQSATLNELIQLFLQVEHIDIDRQQTNGWWTDPLMKIEDVKEKGGVAAVVTKFDLTLRVEYDSKRDAISIIFLYSRDLFLESTIQIMSERFHILLHQLFSATFDKAKQPICELPILLQIEENMLRELNDTNADFNERSIKPINEEFFDRANECSQKLAIILDEQSLTYGETLYFVEQVSSCLVREYYVKAQDIICQCLDRSIEMVIGILATLTCGCVYCPLNPQDPVNRISLLMKEVKPKVLLTHERMNDLFFNWDKQPVSILNIAIKLSEKNMKYFPSHIESMPVVNFDMPNIAYIIFTSGSTGIPKPLENIFFDELEHGQNYDQCSHNHLKPRS
ncbi:unnamed protein product [Rotaria socialis]|nr:unnamed protein product [Rotaria socialis]